MADYREIWLINASGQRYDLSDQTVSKTFLQTPEGFGFRKEYISEKIGNSELITSQKYALTDLTGELVFHTDSNSGIYQDYQDFIQFCKYTPLEFHYRTPNNVLAYHCDVLFTQADKGEIDHDDGLLHVSVTFHRLTEWLTDDNTTYSMTNAPIGDGKYFALKYDYYYAGTNLSDNVIYNTGTDAVGFILRVEGSVTNLQFSLFQNGENYGICKINGSYDFVEVNSIERAESIYLEQNGSTVPNPEQYQDFTVANGQSYLTWIKLRVGESHFSFTCGNIDTFRGTVSLLFKQSYVSV